MSKMTRDSITFGPWPLPRTPAQDALRIDFIHKAQAAGARYEEHTDDEQGYSLKIFINDALLAEPFFPTDTERLRAVETTT